MLSILFPKMNSPTPKLLQDLLGPELRAPADAARLKVSGLSADSRTVAPGMLFAALPGAKADGTRFIADAVARGAGAVLAVAGAAVPELPVPVLRAADPRQALARMAARFYCRQPEVTVAVTGTSGKTSVAEFTRQLFAALGRSAAALGTMGITQASGTTHGSLTTPDPVTLHRILAELAGDGITHLAFEASSHGLDQRRLDGVRLTAAAFTNIGRDHLDYHPTPEDYLAAKLRLFRELMTAGQPVVINADGHGAGRAIAAARERGLRAMTVGKAGEILRMTHVEPKGFAQRLAIEHAGRHLHVELPLLGTYQAENALVAAGLAIATGEDPGDVVAALAALKGVNGRLDIVGSVRSGLVVVDYAHKPEALAAALDALRPYATGRLVCVFGCGGDRDKGKRPLMGRIAAQKADGLIVTDDNPRNEKPAAIRAEILAGAPDALEIGDRALAIHAAIASLSRGDVALIAGKGHETGQIVGDTVIPFCDREVALACIRRETRNG
jgi:UDP-N-acetylmuramoyl-L-alanyl-D-glutamate--2,6-diaminopimelate ligase